MARADYKVSPAELMVREDSVDGRVLVTTMLDPRRACERKLDKLCERRWNIELDLRNIKTTLGLEVLSCKTPVMCEEELWAYLLAYNLDRLLMAQAALQAGLHPRQLSFKHAVQLWTQWLYHGLAGMVAVHAAILFQAIAQQKVGNRPGRIELRARKRHRNPYQWLKEPWEKARRQVRLHGLSSKP